uniref:SAUR family protein SAUR n=1 Tax=Gymnema sylvestre TaxID=4068 RepID=A0A976RUH8_GYMSY|nr:SAUR family protein SAUR [Gymnema sylvestre]
MDLVIKSKGKKNKGLIIKTWERCRSLGRSGGGRKTSHLSSNRGRISGWQEKLKHSNSWPRTSTSSTSSSSAAGAVEDQREEVKEDRKRGRRVAPEGCFSVYVGPKKQRFVIRTQCLNHPLFKVLLEEAESEYGYNSEGPLELPCEVDIFIKVLIEMDDSDDIIPSRCSFGRSYSSYHLLTTSPKIAFLK